MLKAGTILGERYEIVGRVGSGGMADVYKALDHKLNRNVAIKVMKAEFSEDGTFISKFQREAQAAAGLANPNIVNVFDVGEDSGNYYIVMELVEGITLKEYIAKKGKLSVREATSIAIQVCMGLAAAHAQNIVHRDVKPQNIIISTDGKVKVTDFGIARAASSNTISANAMGSVHYSSPEQVRGGYSDSRSDIYSLGITLYEMVTGRVPYDGETTVAIAIKHLQDEMEPPSKYAQDLPYSLEQIIYKCTQKSVDRRYQTMNEVIADLKHSLVEPNGRFVVLSPLSDHAQTVMITPAERSAIRQRTATSAPVENPGRTYSSTSEAQRSFKSGEDDPYDEYEYDGDDDEDGLSSKLEKAMTIGGFIVGALIILVLIYFIGNAAGLFHFGRGESGTGSSDSLLPQSQVSVPADSVVESAQVSEETTAGTVKVPTILGLTEETAQATAQSFSLGIKYQGEKPSDNYPAGTIMEQDPGVGTDVPRNSTIYYYRSSGPASVQIPSVVGAPLADAQSMLTTAGFTNVVTNTENNADVTAGNVISVTPGEGETVSLSTQITLVVSTGPASNETVTLDPYGGLTQAFAEESLRSKGLQVQIQYGTSNNVAEGEVIRQEPAAGSVVNVGSTVILTINDPSRAAEEPSGDNTNTTATTVSGGWVTDSRLGAPSNYTGGAYQLILQQTVNGEVVETVVAQGDAIAFPYELITQGADGVPDGSVILMELVDGAYISRVSWPVQFQEAS